MEGLSILNHPPRRLAGPCLLDHLVADDGLAQNIAIDYLAPDGTREQVTYPDLHRRAERLARRLRSHREDFSSPRGARFIVPLFVGQSPELYVAQLAVLKAGGAFCPIALDVPPERLRFVVRDVAASVLLTTSKLRGSLPDIDGVFILSEDEQAEEALASTEHLHDPAPSSAAYVMYTSGSTGTPKGVLISHAAATQALLAHDQHLPAFSRFLQFASPTFDVSVFEIFFPLFRKATLVCGDRRQLLNDLPGFINRMDVDAAELTPSVASSLLRGRSSVPGLRFLLTIGEMLKRDVVEEFGGSLDQPGILYGMYGPTEATIHCTLQPSFRRDMPIGNIGIPLDTVSAFIVKPLETDGAHVRPEVVPVGEEGELAVGGYQLADGYLGRPEQTTAALVEHPEYGLMYRTGDRAKMTEGGTIECLGRISSGQVKLRGQRIELGEIEYAAAKAPGCQSVVAEVISGTLVVFVTSTGTPVDRTELFETCRKWLPGFMVPGDMVSIDSLPYLPSGKLDRKALHTIYSQQKQGSRQTTEEVSSRLQNIIDVVGTVLGVSIGPSDQLSAAGLDSLSAIRIASELRKHGFDGFDATTLMGVRTPRDIEQAVSDGNLRHSRASTAGSDTTDYHHSATHRKVIALPEMQSHLDDLEDAFAPTPVQMEMLSDTAKNSTAYCNWVELAVSDVSSIDHVECCLSKLAKHHSLLRSGFVALGDVDDPYAVVTWKALHAHQIRRVEDFDRGFTIESEEALLRPLALQVQQLPSEIRILLTLHHALYDQWSMDVLKSDLGALLHSRSIDVAPTFRTLSHHYRMIDREVSVDYWQDHLQAVAPTHLPLMTGKRAPAELDRSTWRDLGHDIGHIRESARSIGCSAPVLYQAALAYLLGSYVGSSDVTLGTVFSGRHVPIDNIERLFGPYLSTLPLRVDYGTTRTVQDLLRLTHDCNRAAQKHSHLPTSQIKSAADLAADVKLFDVVFVWQETTLTSDGTSCSDVREVDSADEHDFSLVVEFEPSRDGVRARATFRQSLITLQQVDVLLQQVSALVSAMVEDPQRLVEGLPQALPPTALSMYNMSPTYSSPGHDLIRAIEVHASRQPSATALVFLEMEESGRHTMRNLSYAELNSRANRMAQYIRTLGRQPSGVICVCMEKSVDLYVSILAVLKAGFGYLPLLPDIPPKRLASIMAQSHVELCLCDSESAESLAMAGAVNILDFTAIDISDMPITDLETTPANSHVAYTVYTSGSTGEPKGVAVTVENLLGNLQVLAELYQVEPGDRLLQACSQAFDVSVFEIFFSWYSGITLCAANKDTLFADLEANIRELQITHLSLTPTVAALIEPANVPTVKFLVTAGEAVTELVRQKWAGCGLHQGYGPSETTNICSINMNTARDDVLGNIGPPFSNTSAVVLAPGDGFAVLPAGAVGEFAFGGEQVFKGYVGMDGLNAEKIVQHPQFGRVYKSGDVGRILHDGTLLISGRLDDQVKIRGNRIELGEINAALLRSDHVSDCTTLVTGESSDANELVSFVVISSAREDTPTSLQTVSSNFIAELFDRLEEVVPGYMIPSLIVAVNKLSRTSQGKLDRRALIGVPKSMDTDTKASYSRGNGSQPEEGEWTDTERTIAAALARGLSLPLPAVSRNASFFSLGLNSLNAISLAKHLSRTLGRLTNPGLILRHPTVSRLARQLDRQEPVSARLTAERDNSLLPEDLVKEVRRGCETEDVEDLLPCTPLQEAMMSASSSSSASYCNTTWLKLSVTAREMKQCWEEMVARHQILRTRFVETESSAFPVVQVVLARSQLLWADISDDDDGVAAEAQAATSGEVTALTPFRVECFSSARGAKLALHMHHAIYDGISMAQLLREVEMRVQGKALPPTPSFKAFLGEVKAQNSQAAMDFWTAKLRGLSPRPFPKLKEPLHDGEETLNRGPVLREERLSSYCKRYGVTTLALLQAALVKTLAYAQNIADVCIGNVVAGRAVPVEDIDRLVAPCFNTIPIRVDTARTRSNLDLVKHLAQSNAETSAYQLSPLRRLQTLSMDPSKRLFDALLLLQTSATVLDGDIWTLEGDVGSMGLPLVLEFTPLHDSLELKLHHSAAIVEPRVAKQLSRAFVAALESCIAYPGSAISHFSDDVHQGLRGALCSEHSVTQPDGHFDTNSDDVSPDCDEKEALVRAVFARLADIAPNRISRDTTMYQLGLDSLNAPQVASQLRSQGYRIDAADVLEGLTPRCIAKSMGSEGHDEDDTSLDFPAFDNEHRSAVIQELLLKQQDVAKIRPTTSVQSGMLSQSLSSHGRLYINHMTYELPDGATNEQLRHAWAVVARKHEMLRAGFHSLHDPQWPFAIVIRSSAAFEISLRLVNGTLSHEAIEQAAQESIIENIATSPWCISTCARWMTISMHHALFDAESLRILLSDLQRALVLEDIGKPVDTDTLLSSTITAERQALRISANEAFWRSKFENTTSTRLPDLNPTIVRDGHLAVETLACGVSLRELAQHCRDTGTSIQALGQTAYAQLLAAWTGEATVIFGTVFSGRSQPTSGRTVFPSVNTIPVVCNTAQPSSELVDAMVRYNAAAHRHRFTPLADIQRFAGQSGRAMFDSVFVYQKGASDSSEQQWPLVRETASVDYAASLELETHGDAEITIRLTFDTGRIPSLQAQHMIRQYDSLLRDLITGRSGTGHMSGSLLSSVAAKDQVIPSDVRLLQQFVQRGALQHPDSIAFEFVTDLDNGRPIIKKWTYLELDEISNQVANAVIDAGARSGSVVALCMDKCPEATCAFVGILKAGCAFLALDPELPEDRITFILQDSNATVLLTSGKGRNMKVPDGVSKIHLVLGSMGHLSKDAPKVPDCSAEETCYVLYTSGTTGQPKGVEITHENAVQAMLAFQRLFAGHWTERSRWLQFASYWFDVSVLEQFWSWSVGISVVGAPRDLVLEDIPGFIRALDITHIDLTPSLARLVHPDEVPSLWGGVFITGGEALKQEIIDAWGAKHTICNGYGPTEATIGVTMNTFVGSDAKPSNIGRAFDNVGAHVLEPDGQMPVIRGGVGELCISGKLVGKGYLNRPDLTSKAFPFVAELGERIYRTGDLVRLLSDNSFQFIGRKDSSQAKLRGQRLETDEIDSVIRQSAAGVADVVSLVVKAASGKETLVSFLTCSGRHRREALRLDDSHKAKACLVQAQSGCAQKLAGYMVPSHIIPLTFVPLTVNKKVDSKRLVQFFESLDSRSLQGLRQDDRSARPLTSEEQSVCRTLSRLLPIDMKEIQSDANLFSLGLSSISAISFASLLKRAGFVRANVATIMKNPTISQLTNALTTTTWNDGQDEVQASRIALEAYSQKHLLAAAREIQLPPDEIEAFAPCTPLQQGLILESLRNDSRPYFNTLLYQLHHVDLDKLTIVLRSLVERVPILRASMVSLDDGYGQVVRRHSHVPITKTVTASTAEMNSLLDRKKRRWIQSNTQDLLSPCEFHIMQVSGSGTLAMFVHHSLYDAISHERTMQLLHSLHAGGDLMDVGPAFADALPYGPMKRVPGSQKFWQRKLEGCSYRALAKRHSQYDTAGEILARVLPTEMKLEERRQSLGVSHQAMAQAAFQIALRKSAATKSVQMYGIVVSGRSIELDEADKVLGPLFNTLPQPVRVRQRLTISDHIRRCHEANVETLPYQHTPLNDIRKWIGGQPGKPLFDTLFVFQHTPTPKDPSDVLWTPIDSPSRPDYPLTCEVELRHDESLKVTLLAQGEYFDRAELDGFMSDFTAILNTAASDPDAELAETFGVEDPEDGNVSNELASTEMHLNGVRDFQWNKEANTIRALVSQLAGLDGREVDEHTSIFALGLDSIDAVKLASRLRNAGLPLPVSDILRAQTIPRMLDRMQARNAISSVGSQPNVLHDLEQRLTKSLASLSSKASDIERILPATPNQEALVAEMLRSDFEEYLNHDVLLLDDFVNVDGLKAAWQTVIDASPVLRTSFMQVEDPGLNVVFAQLVHTATPMSIDELSCDSLDEAQGYIRSARQDIATTLSQSPPLRLAIVNIAERRYLVVTIAHALYDGHSLALIHEDVQQAYSSELHRRPSYDPAIEAAITALSDDSRRYWKDSLANATPHAFPRLRGTDTQDTVHRAEVRSELRLDDIRAFCQSQAISIQALAQTCWAMTLAHYTQRLEVMYGVTLACRDSEEAEQIMFPMMNTVVMRAALHASRAEMLRHMQHIINEMLPHQRTPLREIQHAYLEGRGSSLLDGMGLFDTLFIYQHRPRMQREQRQPLYISVGGSSSVDYPVAVEMEAVGDAMTIRAACKSSVLDREGTQELVETVEHILQRIVAKPDKATVSLKDGTASICGLPLFELPSTDDNQAHDNFIGANGKQSPDAQPGPSPASPFVAQILQAFAQVARIPEGDLSLNSGSTIESIGIDSISAIKVASLLRQKGIKVSVSSIVQAKTAARIATVLDETPNQPAEDQNPSESVLRQALKDINVDAVARVAAVDPQNVETVLPATAGQAYMLGLWTKTGGQTFYPIFKYGLHGSISKAAVDDAWRQLVKREPILRTVFASGGGAPGTLLQLILKADCPASASQRQSMVSLDVREVDSGWELNLKIHHALYDAISLPLLIQNLKSLIAGRSSSEPALTHEDFLALSATPEARSRQKHFWTGYLKDLAAIKLSQPAVDGPQTKVEIFQPAAFEGVSDLDRLARRAGLSLQALLFAAYAKVYTAFPAKTGAVATDVLLGVYLSNRSHLPGLDQLTAPTLNLIPLVIRSSRARSMIDIARQIQDDLSNLGGPEISATSLRDIHEWTGVKVDTFVNFLKLPERNDGAEHEQQGAVKIEEMDEERMRPRREVVAAEHKQVFEAPHGVKGLPGVKAYQHSVDIEMTVRDGKLAVGVFAPVEMLSLEEGNAALEEFGRLLDGLAREDRVWREGCSCMDP